MRRRITRTEKQDERMDAGRRTKQHDDLTDRWIKKTYEQDGQTDGRKSWKSGWIRKREGKTDKFVLTKSLVDEKKTDRRAVINCAAVIQRARWVDE